MIVVSEVYDFVIGYINKAGKKSYFLVYGVSNV